MAGGLCCATSLARHHGSTGSSGCRCWVGGQGPGLEFGARGRFRPLQLLLEHRLALRKEQLLLLQVEVDGGQRGAQGRLRGLSAEQQLRASPTQSGSRFQTTDKQLFSHHYLFHTKQHWGCYGLPN